FFFFSSRRRHTRFSRDWSSDVCSSDLLSQEVAQDPYGFGILLAATRGPGATRDKAYEQLRARQGKLLSSTLFSNFGYNVAAATEIGRASCRESGWDGGRAEVSEEMWWG